MLVERETNGRNKNCQNKRAVGKRGETIARQAHSLVKESRLYDKNQEKTLGNPYF